MNKKTTLKLREMAAKAAINCIPQQIADKPDQRRRFELNTGALTYQKLKKHWYGLPVPERKKLKQSFVDDMARSIAFPVKGKKEKTKPKKRTKNQAKSARRAAARKTKAA